MIELQEHVELSSLNTFRLPAIARWLATVDTADDLVALVRDLRFAELPRFMLGGGSNLVLKGGVIAALFIRFRGGDWRLVSRDGPRACIEADAGLVWHALVSACVDAGLGGIENLALIPGVVGAAPVQNIGAYGVELESVLREVDTVDLRTGERRVLTRGQCGFGYRESVFRHDARHLAITAVRLDLATDAPLSLDYRDLREELAARGIPVDAATRPLVFDMVCAIRRRKLPDPSVIGNAGSFFRNPVVSGAQFEALQREFPAIVGYPQADGRVKVAAGWLIDRAGWKGRTVDGVAVHEQQALVLVNRGGATGASVLALADAIAADVKSKYGIDIEPEPVIV